MAESKVTAHVVDFSNVREGGAMFNKRRVPSGDYVATIVKVEDAEVKGGDNKGTAQYLFTVKLDKYKSNAYPYYCTLIENQLWKLRNLMIAAGINVPRQRVKLDPRKALNKKIGVTMEDDEYDGKAQSVVGSVFPVAELAGADVSSQEEEVADEETEAEEVTDEEDAGDEIDAMDRGELKVAIRQLASDFKFLKSQSDDDLRGTLRELNSPAAADDEDEELEELDIDEVQIGARAKSQTRASITPFSSRERLDGLAARVSGSPDSGRGSPDPGFLAVGPFRKVLDLLNSCVRRLKSNLRAALSFPPRSGTAKAGRRSTVQNWR